jgi:ubiquinone/menaquinone biosynthesis C-methylase UbiE
VAHLRQSIRKISKWGFHQLYHEWAWAYDAVAEIVSLGRWYDWVRAVQPFIDGPRVLEIGTGTGHLFQLLAHTEGLHAFGLDESAQMLRLARRRNFDADGLVRGAVQSLPLEAASFDTIVSTFPSDYVRDAGAIREIERVLRPGGRFVILPAAQLVGPKTHERLMAWALAAVGETPRNLSGTISELMVVPLEEEGLRVEMHRLSLPSSAVFVVVSTKQDPSPG